MSGARLYGGTPAHPDNIFGDILLHSKMAVVDTGTSYALAPLSDILAITQALKKYYDIDCFPDNVQRDPK